MLSGTRSWIVQVNRTFLSSKNRLEAGKLKLSEDAKLSIVKRRYKVTSCALHVTRNS